MKNDIAKSLSNLDFVTVNDDYANTVRLHLDDLSDEVEIFRDWNNKFSARFDSGQDTLSADLPDLVIEELLKHHIQDMEYKLSIMKSHLAKMQIKKSL